MILSVCDSSSTLEVLRIVKIIIKIITIVVPIILIVSTMISFFKDVKDGKSEGLKSFAIKVVAAILIMFIPNLIGVIANIASNDGEYKICLERATKEGIQEARSREVILLIDAATQTLKKSDYLLAEAEVYKLEDSEGKTEALNKLAKLKKLIDLKEKVAAALQSGGEDDYKNLLEEVNKLEDGSLKTSLLAQLKKLREKLDNKGISNVESLLKRVTSKYRAVGNNIYVGSYDSSAGSFSFWIALPAKLKSNLPVVVFLQGLGERGDDYNNNSQLAISCGPIQSISKGYKKWDAIVIHPQVPSGTNQKYSKPFNELIDSVVSSFRANSSKISIMGFSNGCYVVFAMATDFSGKYSAAVPIECSPNASASAFSSTAYWSFTGAGAEGSNRTMPSFANQVSSVNGGNAKHTSTGHNQHNIVGGDTDGYSIINNYDVVEWMIRQ